MKAGISLPILILSLVVDGVIGFAFRTTADRIESFGYLSETHQVITTDGYSLTLFRIQDNAEYLNGPRPAVLMMHGLLSSSDCWVINGPDDSLAFNLVDSGYDVWLGNVRGTPYSRQHLTISNNSRQLWLFSIHELGVIDLPASIDYVLQITQQTSLHYVDHSQGTTILLILLSSQPEYNERIRTAHLLAPVAFMKYVDYPIIRAMSLIFRNYSPLNGIVGDRPLLQSQLAQNLLGFEWCHHNTSDAGICSCLLFSFSGGVSAYFNNSLLPEILNTHSASCSANQLIHLVQLFVSGRFHPYNYGVRGNLQRYGRTSPPNYKLSHINPHLPLHLYYSSFDELSSRADVQRLSEILGSRSRKHFIDLNLFAHIDFLWASNVKDVINRIVLRIMNKAELSL